jgi:hypothetical protein
MTATLLVLGLAALLAWSLRGRIFHLANEAAAAPPATTRGAQHWKRKTAMAIGRPELATGGDDELDAAHDEHMRLMNEDGAMPAGPASVANEAETARAEVATMLIANALSEGRIRETDQDGWQEKFKKDHGAAKTELAAAKITDAELANEEVSGLRKESANLAIANALTEGRILPAEKAKWEGDFANDHAATMERLKKEPKKIKTAPRRPTTTLAVEQTMALENEASRRDQIQRLVKAEMTTNGNDYDAAFNTVQLDPKNKAIFDAMKKPAAKE